MKTTKSSTMENNTYKGNFYFRDEAGALHFLGTFKVRAATQVDAQHLVLDQYWDPRLDAASCSPHYEFT